MKKQTKLTPSQLRMKKVLMPLVEQIINEFDDDEAPAEWDKSDVANVKRDLIPFLTQFSKKTGIVIYGAELYQGSLRYCRYFVEESPDGLQLGTDYEYN